MIIDFHNHLGFSSDGGEAPLEMIMENIKAYNIDKLVLFAIDEEDGGETFENSNQKVIDAYEMHPDVIIPFVRVRPSIGQKAIDEFERCCIAGAKGLKLKTKDGFSPDDAIPILDRISEKSRFPVIIHVEHEPTAQPRIWEPIIRKYPHINFVLAHGGKDHYRVVADMLLKYNNIYTDTSVLSYNRTKWIYRKAGASKLVFGSDFPYSHPAIELKKYQILVEEKADLDMIMFENAQKLLDI